MPEMPRSPLPHEPEYWSRLAHEIQADAAGPLAAYAASYEPWYGVLARRAPALVAASLAIMLVLWLVLPRRTDSSVALDWMERSLEPTEVAGTLIGGAQPPSVDALMLQFAPEAVDGGQR